MGLQLWETFKEAIAAYTGLSPAAFFTILALAVAVYHFVSGFLVYPDDHRKEKEEQAVEPLPPPVQVGEITEVELKQYDGSDRKKPLLMAIKGQIYDVSQSRMFYGPGGPYALFAGKDASRALAKMSFEEQDLTGDISGLGPFELEALDDWEYRFMSKYVKVGTVKKNVPGGQDATTSTSGSEAVTSASGEAIESNAARSTENDAAHKTTEDDDAHKATEDDDAHKTSEDDAPKTIEDDAPSITEDAPKTMVDAPKATEDAPKTMVDAPKTTEDAPKTAADAPETAEDDRKPKEAAAPLEKLVEAETEAKKE